MNQCIRLIKTLEIFSEIRPVYEALNATVGIISILGNLRSVWFKILIKKKLLLVLKIEI